MPLTISQIADFTTPENTATAATAFTLAGIVGTITLTAVSYSPTIVPNVNIVLGGTGSSRTVTITPTTGKTGPVTILITAVDDNDGLEVTMTFLLTVVDVPGVWTVPSTWVCQSLAAQPVIEEDSQGATASIVYHAPYPSSATAPNRPVYGEELSTAPGWVVGKVKVEPKTGESSTGADDGLAEVSITLIPPEKSEGSTSEGEPRVVTYKRRWEVEEDSIFNAPIYLAGGSKALTEEDLADIEAWRQESQPALKKEFKYKLNGATKTLTGNAQHAAIKLRQRKESYRVAYPVVSRTGLSRESLSASNYVNRVFSGGPPGFPAGTYPTGWKWVGWEDDLDQHGRSGPKEGTISFRGVKEADADFYPS